jgi:hypothetical protein
MWLYVSANPPSIHGPPGQGVLSVTVGGHNRVAHNKYCTTLEVAVIQLYYFHGRRQNTRGRQGLT